MNDKLICKAPLLTEEENAECIFQSDFYEIKFWKYNSVNEGKVLTGHADNFCITYVHTGNFLFNVFSRSYYLHTGFILLDKPGYEYRLPPAAGEITIFRFYPQTYLQLFEEANLKNTSFFSNPNLLSLLLRSIPEADYLHHRIISNRCSLQKLEMDVLVIEFLNYVMDVITNRHSQNGSNSPLRQFHAAAIEKAKEYIHTNFSKDISLQEIAAYACVSMCHFCRVFKLFTSFSPYQYLLNVRMKHAEMLLKNSNLPVSEVSAFSGFSRPEHFATTFKNKFNKKPNEYRKLLTA